MNFFQTLAIICFAALLTFLVWQAHSHFFRRAIGGKKTRVTVVVTSDGSPGELEQSVKGLLWLISNNTLAPQTGIVIKNTGGNREVAEMARILEKEHPAVVVAESEALQEE